MRAECFFEPLGAHVRVYLCVYYQRAVAASEPLLERREVSGVANRDAFGAGGAGEAETSTIVRRQ